MLGSARGEGGESMTYWLGIDLGTTYTAAALCRPAKGELQTHVVPLGGRSPAVPSVLFLPGDGSLVVGEAAEFRALTEPDRVVREFKRRIGDEIPLLVGGVQWQAHELAAVLARWVWQWVNQAEGELPEGVALTCPASWGPYKISMFEGAVRATRIGDATRLGRVQLLSEPQAAAIGYASREQVEVGARLAVYDLGGGTFDAAVVRKDSPAEFTLLGRPEGIDRLGGVTFDEMLFEHVCAAAGVPLDRIDPNDPYIIPEVAQLRRACTEAKETLSVDTDVTVPVALGGVRQRIRVTRAEFEDMIRPHLDRTIEALHRALESAAVDGTQLDAILLVGGSSRIPLVSQLISAEFGRAPRSTPTPRPRSPWAPHVLSHQSPGPPKLFSLQPPCPPRLLPHQPPCPPRLLRPRAPGPPKTPWPPISSCLLVPPQRPQMSTMLSGDDSSTAAPPWHRSRKALIGAGALVLLLAVGTAGAFGLPETHRQPPSVRGGTGDDAECGQHGSSQPVGWPHQRPAEQLEQGTSQLRGQLSTGQQHGHRWQGRQQPGGDDRAGEKRTGGKQPGSRPVAHAHPAAEQHAQAHAHAHAHARAATVVATDDNGLFVVGLVLRFVAGYATVDRHVASRPGE